MTERELNITLRENWKDVVGYEGLYQISSYGRLRSKKSIRKPQLNNNGYLWLLLWRKGKVRRAYIHRLVAEAFLPKVDGKTYVDHINTNRLDNRVENLRWCTFAENVNNPISKVNYAIGRNRWLENHRGCNSPFAIKVVGVNIETGERICFNAICETKDAGFAPEKVAACVRKVRKSHKGYRWYKQSEYNKKYGTK